MSIYVKRMVEVYVHDRWIPVTHNGKLVTITDNLTSCRQELADEGHQDLPDKVSSDVIDTVKECEGYKTGWCTLEELYDMHTDEEKSLLEYMTRNYASFDENYQDLSDRELLEVLYVNMTSDIEQIYSDCGNAIYGLAKLIGEVEALSSMFCENDYLSPSKVRLIYTFI